MLKKEEHIARLIFLHLQGNTDEMQEKELTEWRSASLRHEALFQRMASDEHAEKSIARFVKTGEEMEIGWLTLQKEMNVRRKAGRHDRKMKWFRYAAAIAVILSVGGIILHYTGTREDHSTGQLIANNELRQPGSHAILILPDGNRVDLKNEDSRVELTREKGYLSVNEESLSYCDVVEDDSVVVYHTLKVPRGGEYVLMLADSTEVYLNADSRIKYPVNFKGDERRVYLSGEAYFKVKRNEKKPFVVEAERLEIKVLGTTFGVRAYEDEPDIQTTLESGKVLVGLAGESVQLVPNQQALFNKSTSAFEVREVDVDLYLAWKDGRLVYDNCPLEKILTDLSRWYAFDIFYSRDELRSYKFSVNMKKHEVFTRVLELMEKTGDIQFDIEGKTVIVK